MEKIDITNNGRERSSKVQSTNAWDTIGMIIKHVKLK